MNVTVATIAFQDGAPHQCHGDLVAGEVTKTPTPTPEVDLGLDCVVFARNVTIDLTAATAATAIGQYTVPSIVSGDTYLVVRRLNGTLENGSRVTFGDDDFQATGTGHRVNGRTLYGVEFDVVKGNYCKGYCIDYGGFHPDASLDPATHYTFAVDGRIRNGEMVTLTVSRNGTPMAAVLHVEGAAEERYDTGSDGRIKVEVTGAEVFEVEIEHVEAT